MPVEADATEVLQRWGAAIAARRKARGWSQAQLAEAVGVDQRTISAYEVGRQQFTAARGVAIAAALDVKPEDLFTIDPEAVV